MHRVAFAALLAAVVAPFAQAQDPMQVLGVAVSSVAPLDFYNYRSGIIQADGSYSYATSALNPARIAKYRNNPGGAAPTLLGGLTMNAGNDIGGPIFFTDATEQYAVFTLNGVGAGFAGVAKVELYPGSDALPTHIGTSDLSGNLFSGEIGAVTAYEDYMYIGAGTRIVKVAVGAGSTLPSFVSQTTPNGAWSALNGAAVINGPAQKMYFTSMGDGSVRKFTTTGMDYESVLSLPSGSVGAAIDVDNDIGYWVAGRGSSNPGVVYKIALNSGSTAAPTLIATLELGAGETRPETIVLDLDNGYGYVGTASGYVVRIILGGPTEAPTRESSILLNPAIQVDVSLFDAATGMLYVTNDNANPSRYFKIGTRDIPPTPTPTPGGGPMLTATGPKRAIPRGGKAALRFTLAGPAINTNKTTKAHVRQPARELAPGSKKYNTTYYAVSLAVPAGATVLRASTPLGAGKGNKAVINATQVYWPRVPLKEGLPRQQKVNLRVTAKIAKSATGPLLFNATATNLATGSTITAEPMPLAVQLK